MCVQGVGAALTTILGVSCAKSRARPDRCTGRALWAGWLDNFSWLPGVVLLAPLVLLFPDGRLAARRWRWPIVVVRGAAPRVFVVMSVGPAAGHSSTASRTASRPTRPASSPDSHVHRHGRHGRLPRPARHDLRVARLAGHPPAARDRGAAGPADVAALRRRADRRDDRGAEPAAGNDPVVFALERAGRRPGGRRHRGRGPALPAVRDRPGGQPHRHLHRWCWRCWPGSTSASWPRWPTWCPRATGRSGSPRRPCS